MSANCFGFCYRGRTPLGYFCSLDRMGYSPPRCDKNESIKAFSAVLVIVVYKIKKDGLDQYRPEHIMKCNHLALLGLKGLKRVPFVISG